MSDDDIERPKKPGKPQHYPTDEQRAQVNALAGFGVQEAEIARYIGIDPKTLRRWYRDELDTGHIRANAAVAKSLYRQATEGNVAAAIFWLKARAGWREKHDINHTSNDGSMSPNTIKIVAGGGDDSQD